VGLAAPCQRRRCGTMSTTGRPIPGGVLRARRRLSTERPAWTLRRDGGRDGAGETRVLPDSGTERLVIASGAARSRTVGTAQSRRNLATSDRRLAGVGDTTGGMVDGRAHPPRGARGPASADDALSGVSSGPTRSWNRNPTSAPSVPAMRRQGYAKDVRVLPRTCRPLRLTGCARHADSNTARCTLSERGRRGGARATGIFRTGVPGLVPEGCCREWREGR